MPSPQNKIWILTIPVVNFNPQSPLPTDVVYIKGQKELGEKTGYYHWQLVAYFSRAVRLKAVTGAFGTGIHAEPTRSQAAEQYVWKDDTAVDGTRFELGSKPIKRNSKTDWEMVWNSAVSGDFSSIPYNIRVNSYNNLQKIAKDNMTCPFIVRKAKLFVGVTGSGKSWRAWQEAGKDAYSKISTTKFWDGYKGQTNVVIDEFYGQIGLSHILTWLDNYPVVIETKGGAMPLQAECYWITSNIPVDKWYPLASSDQLQALKRRLEIVEFNQAFVPE
jgi:hypothetical protein